MTDEADWPPPGHSMCYEMVVDLDSGLKYTAEVTVVGGDRPNDMATFRWDRLGGPNDQDQEFRAELYRAIGEVTVAGGHAETAMKRVLVVAEDRQALADVEQPWSSLVKRLQKVANTDIAPAAELAEILAWAERKAVKKRRDDVIHSYWWNFATIGVSRSRFTTKGESYVLHGSIDILADDARLLFEYARRLDDLIVSHWPQARLPRTESEGSPPPHAPDESDEVPQSLPLPHEAAQFLLGDKEAGIALRSSISTDALNSRSPLCG